MDTLATEVASAHSSGRSFEHLNDVLVNGMRTYHDRVLLRTSDGERYTGADMEGHVARYAAVFDRLGVGLGTPVGLLAGNSVDVLFAQQALSIIGGVFTPFHPMGTPSDFAYILNDAAIDFVVVDTARHMDMARAVELSGRDTRILLLGGGGENDIRQAAAREAVSRIDLRPIDPEAIVRIIYTGGTTGVPKATQASYRCMSIMFGIIVSDWQWPDEIRQLLVAPLSHSGGIVFTPTLALGGTLYVEPGFDVVRTLAAIERERITCMLMVPTMIGALLDHPRLKAFDLSSLETIFYGASPITPARLREAIGHFGPIFFQFYGQAEAPTAVTMLRREEHDLSSDLRLASCGRPVPEAAVKLLDADGNEVPDGEAGELCVQGPLLMSGYLNKPAETAEALRHGWLHTGDIAVRDPDGFLRLVDRAKDMVISGGFNVYPRAVEDVLEAHPGVASACVFGVPDAHWGEIVVAVVVLRDNTTTIADLIAYVRERKGAVQTPKRIEIVDTIPLTGVGKPDKKQLRQIYAPAVG